MESQLVPAIIGQRRSMLPLQRPRSLSPMLSKKGRDSSSGPPPANAYTPENIMEQITPALHGALDALLRDIESKGRVPAPVDRKAGRRRSSASAPIQPVVKASPAEQAECLRFLAQWLLRNKDTQ